MPQVVCIVDKGTTTSRTPVFQTHRSGKVFPEYGLEGCQSFPFLLKYEIECLWSFDQYVQKLTDVFFFFPLADDYCLRLLPFRDLTQNQQIPPPCTYQAKNEEVSDSLNDKCPRSEAEDTH